MQKILGALVLAAGVLLTGCTTDPATQNVTNIYLDSTGIIPGDSIQYHEIRIDAFSHFWATQKLWRKSVGGNKLLSVDSTTFAFEIEYDTLILSDPSLDKTGSLPAHIVETHNGQISRLVYTALHEPKTFSCYLYRNGGRTMTSDSSDAGDTPDYLKEKFSSLSDQDGYVEVGGYYSSVQDAPKTMERMNCGYFPGKGFYLDAPNFDYYGRDPSLATPGTEIVIRY